MSDIVNIQKILEIWLAKNQADSDLTFYSIDAWRARGEEYHNDAELVIVTEGGLWFALNYNYGTEFTEQFEELLESFGYYHELGHSWNIGIYEMPNYDFSKRGAQAYSVKLRDPRWKRKRDMVINQANKQCQDCGSRERLEVHHCYYVYGLEPWQYPLDSLRCLCRDCHEKRGALEKRFRAELANLSWQQIESLSEGVESASYWYS